jgi:hypothetical protein
MKASLQGERFDTMEEPEARVIESIGPITRDTMERVCNNSMERLKQVVIKIGDCVETEASSH